MLTVVMLNVGMECRCTECHDTLSIAPLGKALAKINFPEKNMPETNVLAYFAVSSVAKKKSFITLASNDICFASVRGDYKTILGSDIERRGRIYNTSLSL